jgi:anti-anti-sigma factor
MSERLGRAGTESPPSAVDTGAPVVLPRTRVGVAGSVSGPGGTALLRVTVSAEPAGPGPAPAVLVAAAGEVDLDTAPLLQAALVDAVDRHAVVCCELSEVGFLSAAGITALLVAYQRAQATGCRLSVRGAHGATRRVLQICGIEQLLGGH